MKWRMVMFTLVAFSAASAAETTSIETQPDLSVSFDKAASYNRGQLNDTDWFCWIQLKVPVYRLLAHQYERAIYHVAFAQVTGVNWLKDNHGFYYSHSNGELSSVDEHNGFSRIVRVLQNPEGADTLYIQESREGSVTSYLECFLDRQGLYSAIVAIDRRRGTIGTE